MWTILSENTNKYVHAKLRQAKDNGDKDPIELLSEGVEQNPCARLNRWEDTSPDEMKVFVAHLIVMGICKKNSLEKYWSRDSILNTPFLATTCPEIIFKTYSFLCKSVKWSKKFFVHCLNIVILNAHILHKKYSDSKITHL